MNNLKYKDMASYMNNLGVKNGIDYTNAENVEYAEQQRMSPLNLEGTGSIGAELTQVPDVVSGKALINKKTNNQFKNITDEEFNKLPSDVHRQYINDSDNNDYKIKHYDCKDENKENNMIVEKYTEIP